MYFSLLLQQEKSGHNHAMPRQRKQHININIGKKGPEQPLRPAAGELRKACRKGREWSAQTAV